MAGREDCAEGFAAGRTADGPLAVPALHPALSRRSVDRQVVCGACGHTIAERRGDVLLFPQDLCSGWRGWRRVEQRATMAGGYWEIAGETASRQALLGQRLELLPAVIECPFCGVPNLFDPKRLNVTADQSAARLQRESRGSKPWRGGRL